MSRATQVAAPSPNRSEALRPLALMAARFGRARDDSRYNGCMSAIDRITVNPAICGGRPCIRGLRIRVKDVLDLLAAGATRDEILADYPYLEADDIAAVLEFAARQNDHPVLRSA
jgi:uncharacterized protein (DUF433 family)